MSLHILSHFSIQRDTIVVEGRQVRQHCLRHGLLHGLQQLSARHTSRTVEQQTVKRSGADMDGQRKSDLSHAKWTALGQQGR